MLDKYVKLKELYENLRPVDVKFTLEHDDWKRKIDKTVEDKSLMMRHDEQQKKAEQAKTREEIEKNFQKYCDGEFKEFMTDLNEKKRLSDEERTKSSKKLNESKSIQQSSESPLKAPAAP